MNNDMNNNMNNNTIPAMNFGPPQPEQNSPAGASTLPEQPVVSPIPEPAAPAESQVQQPISPAPVEQQPIQPAVSPMTEPVVPAESQVQQPIGPTPVAPQQVQPAVSPIPEPVASVGSQIQQPISPTPVAPQQMPTTGTTEINGTQVNGSNGLEETEKKKTPILMILLTILVVVGVGVFLTLYLTGKINFGGSSNSDVQESDTTNTGENIVELATWMNYLLEQNITEIKLTRTTEDGSGNAEATITADQLRAAFNEIASYTLEKGYTSGIDFTYGTIMSITYSKDNNNYTLEIAENYLRVQDIKDQDLLDALENSNPNQSSEATETDNILYYSLNGFNATIYDKYFTPTTEEESQDESNEVVEETPEE